MKTELAAREQRKTAPVTLSYGVAVLSVAVASILAKAAEDYLHSQPFALLFLCAILFSAWVGGFGPALLALALSLLVFAYYFLNPTHTLAISLNELPRLIIFAAIGVTLGLLTASQRRITASLRQTNESLQAEIAERKQAEEAVRESQQLLHLVLATLPVGVAVTDRAGDILLANAASKRIWGDIMIVSGSERWAQSKGFWHDSGKRIAPANWGSVRAISEGLTSLNELIDIETFDGRKKTIQNSSAPVRNAEGLIVGAVIVNEDVTERVRAEKALKKAEDNLRFVLDTTPAMIHTARPDGYLDYFNQRWLDYVGLPLEGLAGWAWMAVIHPEDIEGEVNRWRACVASGEPFECEVRARRADGKYRWMLHRKVAIRDEHGSIVKWCGSATDIDDRKQAEQMLRDSNSRLRALSARLQSVREEEATRIAREIHDDSGQKLTGLKMDLQRAERKIEGLETSPTVNSILDSIVSATELTDGFTASIQQIAANLRPSVLDKLGLAPALQYEARAFERRTGIHCAVRLPETEVILSSQHATALFRIFQEALTNVARHAHATKVKVELGVEAGSVIINVQDDGRGITEADIARPESLGLLGMKERAELLGGEMTFQRNSNQQGTVVAVRIPQMGEPVSCGC
jgi:PAS domain S-box-containing protein